MSKTVSLKINANNITVLTDSRMTLLTYLRNTLGLMGAKNGCAKGHCGTCTIIVNGEAKRACLVRVEKLDGAVVETIEGISQGSNLHPIQKAFIDAGAVQCGFCTPGMIMSTKALLDKNLDPTEEDIKDALKHNICRCTGYIKILDAVKLAAKHLRDQVSEQILQNKSIMGASPRKIDARDKAIGKAIYADDYMMEGMLHGKFLFSEYSHAEIVSIDISEAQIFEGVAIVLTAKDIPGENNFGLIVPQQPVLADKRVRYLGDVVAAVFAETPEIAEEAIKRIRVEYKPLETVFSAIDSMEENALQIHDEEGNVMHHVKVRRGDIEKGFAKADIIVEDEYYTPAIEHAYLEPEACLSKPEEDGSVTIWTGSQGSHPFRRMIARSLGIEEEMVRIIYTPCGGAFGGKEEPTVQIQSALAALKTGRPVKMVLSREESIRISTKRHAEHIYMKHGATADGKLVAFESRAICDTGAYISLGKPVVFRSAVVASGPYEIPNVKADSYGVYTNNNPAGAFRGFGSTQVAFASELQMDKIARKLGMDPVQIRRINGLTRGKVTITGQVLGNGIGYLETLDKVEKELKIAASEYESSVQSPTKKIGIGIASSYKNVGLGNGNADGAGAVIELNEKGKVVVKIGAIDMGQGSDTAMAQIAAASIGINYDLIEVLSSDTKLCPDGEMTTASRQTYVTGNAVKIGSEILKEKILAFMEQKLDVDKGNLGIEESGNLINKDNGKCYSFRDIFIMAQNEDYNLKSDYHYLPPKTYRHRECADHEPGVSLEEYNIHYAYCFGTQGAVVEVDTETGEVKVLKIIAAQDVGKAIHPQNVEGQIEGSVVMGIGYALSEKYIVDDTKVVTDNLKRLGIPPISMTPAIESIIVEVEQPEGPFGAKGMGEVPINPTAPAIVNAIYDAVGVRVNKLPVKKDNILEGFRNAKKL